MVIYGLKNCDTCRKARKALPEAEFVDVREAGVPEDVLARAFETFGARLINTRSTTWRELDAEARQAAPAALIAPHPAVMKRPLVADTDRLVLGWDRDAQAALGLA